MDTNGGSCTRQATAGSYVDAQACASLNAAYQAAQAGDRVLIKAGSYPAQTINDRTNLAIGSARVEFHPAPGESLTFTDALDVKTHDVLIDGGDTAGVNEQNRIQVNGDPNGDQAADFGWGNNSAARDRRDHGGHPRP